MYRDFIHLRIISSGALYRWGNYSQQDGVGPSQRAWLKIAVTVVALTLTYKCAALKIFRHGRRSWREKKCLYRAVEIMSLGSVVPSFALQIYFPRVKFPSRSQSQFSVKEFCMLESSIRGKICAPGCAFLRVVALTWEIVSSIELDA